MKPHRKPGDEIFVSGRRYIIKRTYPTGYNSAVYETQNGDKGTEVLKIYGEHVSINTAALGPFVTHLRDYYWQLNAAGVRIPPYNDRIAIQNNGTPDTFHVIVIAPFMGDDYETLLQQARDEQDAIAILRTIFRSLGKLLHTGGNNRIGVGIDLIPRNFVGPKATYVDLVPPKIMVGNRYLLEYPDVRHAKTRQIGIYRHFDRFGIMHVLLVQVARQRPQFYPTYAAEIERFLKRQGFPELADQFSHRMVAADIIGKADDIPMISRLNFTDIYTLREIACLYAQQGILSRTDLESIFTTSHFQDKPLPQANITEIKKQLIAAVS